MRKGLGKNSLLYFIGLHFYFLIIHYKRLNAHSYKIVTRKPPLISDLIKLFLKAAIFYFVDFCSSFVIFLNIPCGSAYFTHIYPIKSNLPAIWASYASPTPHKLLLATPAITPAQLLPCLGLSVEKEFSKKIIQ